MQRLKAKLDKQKAMAEQDLAHQRLEVTRLQEQLRVRQHPRNTILVQHYVGMSLRGFVHVIEGGVCLLMYVSHEPAGPSLPRRVSRRHSRRHRRTVCAAWRRRRRAVCVCWRRSGCG